VEAGTQKAATITKIDEAVTVEVVSAATGETESRTYAAETPMCPGHIKALGAVKLVVRRPGGGGRCVSRGAEDDGSVSPPLG
jgi:hypothetical protein